MATDAECNSISLARIRRRQIILGYSAHLERKKRADDRVVHAPTGIQQSVGAQGLSVIVHRTDDLQASEHLQQQVVRISLVDLNSGEYVKKSKLDRCAVSYYENQNSAVDYILPIQTQPFKSDGIENLFRPSWEESLFINEDPSQLNQDTLFFFELFSLPSLNMSWMEERKTQTLHKIAWLQLYTYIQACRKHHSTVEVFNQWAQSKRVIYPSTLYVTLKVTRLETEVEYSTRSMGPYQKEQGSTPVNQLMMVTAPFSTGVTEPEFPPVSLWTRSAGQSCLIPNTLLELLQMSCCGCSALTFSPNGRYLACGGLDNDKYPVIVWELPSWTLSLRSDDHRGLVYGFSWSEDSSLLVSASADSVCRVWSGEKFQLLTTLPHPCYVYGIQFGSNLRTVFTAAYDGYVRLWRLQSVGAELIAELKEHTGLVNCLAWDANSCLLYSCDSDGGLNVWYCKGTPILHRRVKVFEQGESILHVALHSNGKKILIRTFNALVMFDLRIDKVICTYKLPASLPTCSLISPCGSLIIAGAKNGDLYVWRPDGTRIQPISCSPLSGAVSNVAFHPTEHMMAVSSIAQNQPLAILVYK